MELFFRGLATGVIMGLLIAIVAIKLHGCG
jgi:hypothetical protein